VATCDNTGRTLEAASSVTVSSDGESAYVSSAGSDAVAVFDRDTTSGALTQKAGTAGCIVNGPSADVATCDNAGRALNGAESVTVSPDGKSVYIAATSSNDDAVAVFDRDTTSGALTQKAGAAGCIVNGPSADVATCDNTGRALDGANDVAVSPDGGNAYVASVFGNAVALFDRDKTSGALTQKAGTAGCIVDEPSTDVATCDNVGRALISLESVTVSPDGKSVYVASTNGVAAFDIGAPPVCAPDSQSIGFETTTRLALVCAANGDPFTLAVASPAAHGVLGGLSQAPPTISYTPNAGFSGDDSFSFAATSRFGVSDPALFALNVLPVQQGPTGQQGPVGQQGPTGQQGPAGRQGPRAFKLLIALFERRLKATAGKSVRLRYVATLGAAVRLDVLRASKVVARVNRRAHTGANSIAWNGRRGRKAAAPGNYRLRLTAVNGTQTATATASLRLNSPKR
jgi:hypothetical protein